MRHRKQRESYLLHNNNLPKRDGFFFPSSLSLGIAWNFLLPCVESEDVQDVTVKRKLHSDKDWYTVLSWHVGAVVGRSRDAWDSHKRPISPQKHEEHWKRLIDDLQVQPATPFWPQWHRSCNLVVVGVSEMLWITHDIIKVKLFPTTVVVSHKVCGFIAVYIPWVFFFFRER